MSNKQILDNPNANNVEIKPIMPFWIRYNKFIFFILIPIKRIKEISFAELKQHPIMMLNRKSTTSEFLHNLFIQHQLELVPEIELNSNDLLIDMARIGLGIAFVPNYCINPSEKDLYILKTKELLPSRQIIASVNTAFPISASTEQFLQLLPEV